MRVVFTKRVYFSARNISFHHSRSIFFLSRIILDPSSFLSRSNIRDKYKIDAPVNEEEEESEEEDDDGFSGQKKKEEVEEDPVERKIHEFKFSSCCC